MKKVLLAVTAMALVGVVHADLVTRNWSSQLIPSTGANVVPWTGHGGTDYDGQGFDVGVVLSGSATDVFPAVPTPSNGGWYDGYGYSIAGFSFSELEGETIVMRMYNGNFASNDVTYYAESIAQVLSDIEGPIGATDLQVTFAFAPGTTWTQIVPEPGTVGLMGAASVGLFLARRKAQRKLYQDPAARNVRFNSKDMFGEEDHGLGSGKFWDISAS